LLIRVNSSGKRRGQPDVSGAHQVLPVRQSVPLVRVFLVRERLIPQDLSVKAAGVSLPISSDRLVLPTALTPGNGQLAIPAQLSTLCSPSRSVLRSAGLRSPGDAQSCFDRGNDFQYGYSIRRSEAWD